MANTTTSVSPRPGLNITVTCPHPAPSGESASPSGLSPLAAKVLDQLSITAWLPAALLIANTYVVAGLFLVQPATKDNRTTSNLEHVVSALNSKPVGIILAVVLGIVIATMLTQSLEYAAIRFLEGYWGGSLAAGLVTQLGTQFQQWRRAKTERRAEKVDAEAFQAALWSIKDDARVSQEEGLYFALTLWVRGRSEEILTDELADLAEDYYLDTPHWRPMAPAHLRHQAAMLDIRQKSYPRVGSRLMPTRLGNVLRRAEEELVGDVSAERMRGYLFHHLDEIPQRLLEQHHQYRNRLDMCAVMTVLASILTAVDGGLLLLVLPWAFALGAVVGWPLIALLSYRGAVAAAVDYGSILGAINKAVEARPPGATAAP